MGLEWHVKKFQQLSNRELFTMFKIRESVFVVEQNCPYHEIDNHDLESRHVFAMDESKQIVAYARIFREEDAVTFGRVLVAPDYRGKGVGNALIGRVMQLIGETDPDALVKIEAQDYIQPLYAHFGFKKVSDVYLIDNIPHVQMVANFKIHN
jgi:Predicted acyltransferase